MMTLPAQIRSYALLERGWDSYDAEPPTQAVVERSVGFDWYIRQFGLSPRCVNPSVVGGVGFTFGKRPNYVYVEFRNTGSMHAAFTSNGKTHVVAVQQDEAGYADLMAKIREHLMPTPPVYRSPGITVHPADKYLVSLAAIAVLGTMRKG